MPWDCTDCPDCRGWLLHLGHQVRLRQVRRASGLRVGRDMFPPSWSFFTDDSLMLEMRYLELRAPELDLDDLEMPETRGFAMRRGHKGKILRMARARAAKQLRGVAAAQLSLESSMAVMPGRNLFSRRAGNFHHVERCGWCHPGRHHGAGGKKSSKKSTNGDARLKWLEVVREARDAEKAAATRCADFAVVPELSDSEHDEGLSTARPQVSNVVREPKSKFVATQSLQPAEVLQPPPPVAVAARAKPRVRTRRRGARCVCCPSDGKKAAEADGDLVSLADFVVVRSDAGSEEWEVI